MNILLWILQVVAAIGVAAPGVAKLVLPREALVKRPPMAWAKDFSDGQVKLVGLVEVVGALGLVVPWATGILPVLTPIAAACLALIMAGAIAIHLRRKESATPAVVLGAMCVVIAVGRAVL
ncbi:MAG: DoxX family protein [Myxococcota bacterium]